MARLQMTSRATAIHGPLPACEEKRARRLGPTKTSWSAIVGALALVMLLLAACGPSGPTGAPNAPGDVAATPIAGGVRVTWVDQSSDEQRFVVYRKVAGEQGDPSTQVGVAGPDEQSFDDFSVDEDGAYVYGVAAENVVGSSETVVQTPADPVTPLPGIDVALTFDGEGTVAVSGAGVRKVCTSDCLVSFAEGSEITLDAEDREDSVFAGWAGACTGAGTCTVVVDEPLEVEARFRRHVLQLSLAGDSPVELTISPADDFGTRICTLARGDECALAYGFAGPLQVSINAVKLEPEGQFIGFDGPCSTEQGSYCLINVTGATAVAVAAIRPPVADGESYQTNEDVELDIGAENGVLANDVDSDDDTLRAVLVSEPSMGQLELRADGSFTYLPDANANGADSFQYRARDEYGNESDAVTVGLDVQAVNDPPVFTIAGDPAVDSSSFIQQPFQDFATDIGAGGGPDEDGQTLNFSVAKRPGGIPLLIEPTIDPAGTLRFTLLPGVFGQATYDVTLKDSGGTANGGQDTSTPQSFTITVGSENLTVDKVGSGDIVASPPSASGQYAYGTDVTLTAAPASDWAFGRWSGSCSGAGASPVCALEMTTDHDVTGRFDPFLVVEFDTGFVNFQVSSSPPRISCWSQLPEECSAPFPPNSQVTLQVAGGTPYQFRGVECTAQEPTTTCTFTITNPLTVTISNSP